MSRRALSRLLVTMCIFCAASVPITQAREVTESIQLAIASHPEISAAIARLQAEQITLDQVESGFLPSVTLGLGLGKESSENASTRAAGESGARTLSRRESSITLRQMLFDGFETHWQQQGQENSINAQRYALANTAEELALEVTDAHLALALANQLLTFNIANLQAHEKIASDMAARVRSGKDDRAKVNQIHARLSLSLANVEASKAQALSANADYLALVNEGSDRLSFNPLKEQTSHILPPSLSTLITRVESHDEALQTLGAKYKAAQAQNLSAGSHRLPKLYLEAGANWDENLDGVEGDYDDRYVMFRLQYDLYNGGASAKERKAKLEKAEIRYQLEDQKRIVKRDAERLWHQYQAGHKRVLFLKEYVQSAQLTKEAYTKQFQIGQRSLIDLLDAENELLRAQSQLAEAEKSYYLSQYQLLAATGDLLDLLDVQKPDSQLEES